jgi:hypothetical protein
VLRVLPGLQVLQVLQTSEARQRLSAKWDNYRQSLQVTIEW